MAKQRAIVPYPEEQSATAWWFSDYYTFDEQSIVAFAPPDSGVYGLYSFDRQVFIGESSNIREALLHHCSKTDFDTDRDRPISFMFEVCSDGSRAQRAQELIAKYQPVLQTEPLVDDSWSFVSGQETSDPFSFDATQENRFDVAYHSLPEESRPVERKRFIVPQGKVIALGATLALGLALIFHFGVLKWGSIQKTANAGFEGSRIGIPNGTTADELAATAGAPPQPAPPTATKNEAAMESVESTPEAKAQGRIKGSDDTASVPAAVKPEASASIARLRVPATGANRKLAAGARESARSSVARVAGRGSAWTVQVGAGMQKELVAKQVARTKAKGYKAYMVETERDGQTWYRVRVGRFATRSEAEALRRILTSREGYRSPFITND
jgi:cell division septation protein DedD